MRKQAINWLVTPAIMVLVIPLATSVNAAYLLKYEEVGTDVVARGSGSLDLTDLNLTNSGEVSSYFGVLPSQALACVGPLSVAADTYQGFVGPTSFGSGGLHLATSSAGDFTGIVPLVGNLHPPGGYISGASLFGEAIFANSDFEDLGLTPGAYVWSWGTGRNSDTFTLEIGVPEPSTWALLLAGFGALGMAGFHRARKVQTIVDEKEAIVELLPTG